MKLAPKTYEGPAKGAKVIVLEGPERGTEGTLEDVYRCYDSLTGTVGKRCTIRVPAQSEDETDKIIRTRLAWIRETEEEAKP